MKFDSERNAQVDSNLRNTKKAAKRRKMNKTGSIRQPSRIGLIYAKSTGCQIADEATEKRLKSAGPSLSVRMGGMQFKW
jgi:hypothetical protein